MTTEGYRADLARRLDRTRADIEHIESLIEQHVDFADKRADRRLTKLENDLRNAQLDGGRLQGLLAELDHEKKPVT